MRISLFLLLSTTILFSCNPSRTITDYDDCTFEQVDSDEDGRIDDDERAIMEECMEKSYESKSEIEENLIGEWAIIGHGEGWSYSVSQPCAFITISDEALVLEINNSSINSKTAHTWNIKEITTSHLTFFTLQIEPAAPISLGFRHFCKNYMYVDETPLDGNMYLFQKVK